MKVFCFFIFAFFFTWSLSSASITQEKVRYIIKVKSQKGSSFQKNSLPFYFTNKLPPKNNSSFYSNIEYVEENYELKQLGYAPNDPGMNEAWHLINKEKKGADINISKLWDKKIFGKEEIKIAVIDSGVEISHPDLKDNIYINKLEIPGNGIDDDSNGYIDDVNGFDFIEGNSHVTDENGHGTHIAGIIAATANNTLGVTGIAWKAKIIPIKFLNVEGRGDTASAIKAIYYAIQMGAKIINASWGGDPYSQALYDAIQDAKKAGIIFVAAAGNDENNNDINPLYPASYNLSNIVSVGATASDDHLASFSNFGKNSVHVAAPGVLINSTYKAYYERLSGTSMAAPVVAGSLAFLWSEKKELSSDELIQRLVDGCDVIYELKRKVKCGGRINLYNSYYGIKTDKGPDEKLFVRQNFSLETNHPYESNYKKTFAVQSPGAKFIRVHFEKIETDGFDKIEIKDSHGNSIEVLKGEYKDYFSEPVKGDNLQIEFSSDLSLEKYGFKIDYMETIK